MYRHNFKFNSDFVKAIKSGNEEKMTKLQNSGHLNMFKPYNYTKAARCAAKKGDYKPLLWYIKRGLPIKSSAYNGALGNITVMEFLYAHGCPLNEDLYVHCIQRNDFKTLNWLKSKKTK